MPRVPVTPPIVLEPSDQVDHSPTIPGLAEEESDGGMEPSGARRVENLHRLFGESPGRYGVGVYAPPQADPPSEVPMGSPSSAASVGRARIRLGGPGDLLSSTTLEMPTAEVVAEVAEEYDPTLVPGRRIEILPEPPRAPVYTHEISEPLAMAEAEDEVPDEASAEANGPWAGSPAPDLGEGRATLGEVRQAGRQAGIAAMEELARRAVLDGQAPGRRAPEKAGGAGAGQRLSGGGRGKAMSRTMVEEIEEGMTIGEEDVPSSDAPGADLASRAGRYEESGHPWLRQPRHSGIPDWAPLSAIVLWVVVSVAALADRLL